LNVVNFALDLSLIFQLFFCSLLSDEPFNFPFVVIQN